MESENWKTNRSGGDTKNLILALICEHSSGSEYLEWGIKERNDGGNIKRGPLGGCSDRANSPSIKLNIENVVISYYCGCNWRMEKKEWLFQFEGQRRNHIGLGQKNIWREKRLLTTTNKLNIHQCHTTTADMIPTHTLLWKAQKENVLWSCCWQQNIFKCTLWKQIIKQFLKTTSKGGSKDAFKDNMHTQAFISSRSC